MNRNKNEPVSSFKSDLNNTTRVKMTKQDGFGYSNPTGTDPLARTLNLNNNYTPNDSSPIRYDNGLSKFIASSQNKVSPNPTNTGRARTFQLPDKIDLHTDQKINDMSILSSFIPGGFEGEIKKNIVKPILPDHNQFSRKDIGDKEGKDNSFVNFSGSEDEQKMSLKESGLLDQKMGIPVNETKSRVSKFKSKRKPVGKTKKNTVTKTTKTRDKSKKKEPKSAVKQKGKSKTPVKKKRSNSIIGSKKKTTDKSGIKRTNTMTSNRVKKGKKEPVKKSGTMVGRPNKSGVKRGSTRTNNKLPIKGKPANKRKKELKSKRVPAKKAPTKPKKKKKTEESFRELSEGISEEDVFSELSDLSIIDKKYGDGNYIDEILRKCSLRYGKFRNYTKVPYADKLLVKGLLIDVLNDIIVNKLGVQRHKSFMAIRQPQTNAYFNQYDRNNFGGNVANFNNHPPSPINNFRNPAQSVILGHNPRGGARQGFDLDRSIIKNFMYDQKEKEEEKPTDNILADLDKSIIKQEKKPEIDKSFNIINNAPKNQLNKSINIISYNPKKQQKRSLKTFSVLNPTGQKKEEPKVTRTMQDCVILNKPAVEDEQKRNSYDIVNNDPLIFNSEKQNLKEKQFKTTLVNQYLFKDNKRSIEDFNPGRSNMGSDNNQDNRPNEISNVDILQLNNALSNDSSLYERKRNLLRMFKKIIVYSSKIEELKLNIFEENPSFDLVSIFQLYDEDDDGELTEEEFCDIIIDIGLKTTEAKIISLINYLKGNSKETSNRTISFSEFVKLFYPFGMNNESVHNFYNSRNERGQSEFSLEESKVIIREEEIFGMRQILVMIVKKIDDLKRVMKKLEGVELEELFYIVTDGQRMDITWKVMNNFFESNKVNYLEEDLVHVFRYLESKNFATISFQEFSNFFKHRP